MNRALLLFVVGLPLGCALDTGGTGASPTGGSGGGADVATVGGSGGTPVVDASWPDAAAGSGATHPGDAAPDLALDSTLDVVQEATPEAGVESNCTNGLDDDGDGVMDCEDPDCSALARCVPEAPASWKGPVFVRVRGDQDPVTDCGSMPTAGTYHMGLVAPVHTCTCSCGNPTGGSCGDPVAVVYPSSDCSGLALTSFAGAGCHPLTPSGTDAPKSVRATNAPATALPTCPPSAIANAPDPSWSQAVDTCVAEQSASCNAKEVCLPVPPPGMETMACVLRSGDQSCPTPFTTKRVFHASFDDSRECPATGCSCHLSSMVACGGMVRAQGNKECSFPIGAFKIDGTCHAITTPTPVVAIELESSATPSGSCTAVGSSSPKGTVVPGEAHTVCCLSL